MPFELHCHACGAAYRVSAYQVPGSRFCSRLCQNRSIGQRGFVRHPASLAPAREIARARDPVERFWSKVQKGDGCWNWQGFVKENGYGDFLPTTNKHDPHVYAHRYSYALHHGAIPDGLYVCHRCDNRRCVRPDHLFLGTHKDNQEDMARKGRQGCSKLSREQVIEIREQIAAGARGVDLARRLGVSKHVISKAARGVNYAWV